MSLESKKATDTARRRAKAKEKADDKRIDAAYKADSEGVQIDIMDIPKIFVEGRRCIAEGQTDEELRTSIAKLVASIRKN